MRVKRDQLRLDEEKTNQKNDKKKVKVLVKVKDKKKLSHVQLFETPMACSLPVSSVHGILQIRILEWVPMPSSRGSS